ncbi:hypothetical protein OC846_001527 [Tilletia horrida]|uniref:Glucanase n=1 Tax=Tilletia horrida TaxID=155126 RepID=A0AAN6GWB0_9BASI|nr:hypothetical protein OC845_001487 [Tilletia horrida]KAK0555975.1 hypothetical protein OC846_001527 [Tilletia horrida]KAK0568863.1 hypothetical protein OC861_001556 [Tilletia horrida]
MKFAIPAVVILASSVVALPVADDKRLVKPASTTTTGIKVYPWNPPGGGYWGKREPSPTGISQPPALNCPGGQCWKRAEPTPLNMDVRTISAENCTGGQCWGRPRSAPTQVPRSPESHEDNNQNNVAKRFGLTKTLSHGQNTFQNCPGGQCWDGYKRAAPTQVARSPEDNAVQQRSISLSGLLPLTSGGSPDSPKNCPGGQCWYHKRSTTDKDDGVSQIAARNTQNCPGGQCFGHKRSAPTQAARSVAAEEPVAARNTLNCPGGQCWDYKRAVPTQAQRSIVEQEPIAARNASNCISGQCWRLKEQRDLHHQILSVQNPKGGQSWRRFLETLGGKLKSMNCKSGNCWHALATRAEPVELSANPNPSSGNYFGRAEP